MGRNRLLVLLLLLLAEVCPSAARNPFIQAGPSGFRLQGRPYAFIGANYWYGGLLALEKDPARGIDRLRKELDFLQQQGVTNLRILAGAEGSGQINGVTWVAPALQPEQGVFSEAVSHGLDVLLAEMAKRKMYAVIYLSNNWEWSGGFLQYLNWQGQLDGQTLQRKLNWDEQREWTSRFYSCTACIAAYRRQVVQLLNRKNQVTGRSYRNEPAIMAWELANEPRPMRAEAVPAYRKWISETAALIRSIDSNHLVTIGTEGVMGTEESAALYSGIHADPAIDYLTLHIWPKNWGWFSGDAVAAGLSAVQEKISACIGRHLPLASALKKPLVIEEFGLPREAQSFDPAAATLSRDACYRQIFQALLDSRKNNGPLCGVNFWAYGGSAKTIAGQPFWKKGDDLSGDPPQEEQGLNSVFNTDVSTWKIIRYFSALIK